MNKSYLGIKDNISPEDLSRYEEMGLYACEEKHDGNWCEITTSDIGVIASMIGRSEKAFDKRRVPEIVRTTKLPANSIFVCELMVGTEQAARSEKILFVFDVVKLLGHDVRGLPYEKRRVLLETVFLSPVGNHTKLVKSSLKGFSEMFLTIEASGGEGVVLKRTDKPYKASSGNKTEHWKRCKRKRYVDYVCLGEGKSEGGSTNIQVGLYVDGVLTRVGTIKNPPKDLDIASLVGSVIECVGAEVHASGMLRHAHFYRTRQDKSPEECVIEKHCK